jgi:Spy/CpxP family protein refolding chaperone
MSKWMLLAVVSTVGTMGCGGGARGERLEKLVALKVDDALDDVDATQAQRERVQAMTKETLTSAKPVVEQALATRSALVSEWKAERPDSARVHQLIDAQLDSLRSAVHRLADQALELHQVLTPAQRERVTERLERFERRTPR